MPRYLNNHGKVINTINSNPTRKFKNFITKISKKNAKELIGERLNKLSGRSDVRIENTTIIRNAARQLFVQVGSLRFEAGITDKDYIELLSNTIDEFRSLFIV